jgi:hypothetical protein
LIVGQALSKTDREDLASVCKKLDGLRSKYLKYLILDDEDESEGHQKMEDRQRNVHTTSKELKRKT